MPSINNANFFYFMHRKPLTYSHSLFIPLTRACGASCRYCTFKQNDGKLLTFDEIENLVHRHAATGICEVVIAAGQSLEAIPEIQSQWTEQGYSSFIHYVSDVCQLILENNLIPSLEIGPLSYAHLETVAPFVASITVMLENVNTDFTSTIQEGKNTDEKIETISDAGLLRIPVTTGVLLGVGETLDDGFATLNAIEELHHKYGHIQSVVFQYVYSEKGALVNELVYDELQLLIKYSRQIMPEVAVSIPINSPLAWLDGIAMDIDDIGHVYEGTDGINLKEPFPKLPEIERTVNRKDYFLKPRFSIFESMYKKMALSEQVRYVLNDWISKKTFVAYQ
jgi:7,8-didemethyl-8-hydroxy-5-deazariboflavin synthase CofG subunit